MDTAVPRITSSRATSATPASVRSGVGSAVPGLVSSINASTAACAAIAIGSAFDRTAADDALGAA
jgi:hypothetical protein